MNKNEHIKKIEETLRFNYEAGSKGSLNHPVKEKVRDYKKRVSEIEYHYYISSGDLHYFIGRQLFIKFIGSYAFFCAHQCVENYLKALLKFIGQDPPNSHILGELIELLRENTKKIEYPFIHSEEITMITSMFEPFYEFARYPVQKIRPQDGRYMIMFPDGIEVLDLFVYRMRELISIPEGTRDNFTVPHIDLAPCAHNCPDFYDLFKSNNINFE